MHTRRELMAEWRLQEGQQLDIPLCAVINTNFLNQKIPTSEGPSIDDAHSMHTCIRA